MVRSKALVVASVASMIQQFNMPSIKLLSELGYDVEVACNFLDSGTIPKEKSNEFKQVLKKLNIKYHQVDFSRNPFKIFQNIKAFIQIKKIMKREYDLVHSHSPIGGALTRIAANKYRKNGLKSIYTAHGFHFYKGGPMLNWLFYYPIEKFLSKKTDILITINQDDYNLAKKKFKMKKIELIHGVGIDSEKFFVDKRLRVITRSKLNLTKDDLVLINIGELNNNKNQIFLIESMSDLIKSIPNIKLLLVGQGPNYSNYKLMIESLGLTEHVFLLGYQSDINSLLNASDILVSCSYREGLPVNVMEAMTVGLPIIATNIRGNRDLIENNVNGYLISHSINELKKFIYILESNDKIYQQIAKNNLEKSKNYSYENILKNLKLNY